MYVIYKWELGEVESQQLLIPEDRRIIHIGEQGERLYLWVLGRKDSDQVPCNIFIYGTGQDVDERILDQKHLKTVQMSSGLVWHIFEEI